MASTTILRRPSTSVHHGQATPRRNDEDMINRSLMDSLNEQADAEPLSSSDSEPLLSPSTSSLASPTLPFHMQSSIHSAFGRSDSPALPPGLMRSPTAMEAFGKQNSLYNNIFHSETASIASSDTITPRAHEKLGSKVSAFPAGGRSRFTLAREGGREYGSFPDIYPATQQQQAHPRQSHDALNQFEFGPTQSVVNGQSMHSRISFSGVDPFGAMQQQNHNLLPRAGMLPTVGPRQQLPAFHPGAPQQQAGPPSMHSQTPFGPHLPVGLAASASLSAQTPLANNLVQPTSQEEISTIFVVGFPDDMQEREFQNMFTFSTGFEAATLKIPNKESTAYGAVAAASRSAYPFGNGPNDPYNLVQGGLLADNGRDGLGTTWSAAQDAEHFGANQPPRKQIIGFAKFRTRQEALEARDILQGRRVDAEKGAVLKAEMAKKNLHTKRGVGQPGMGVPGSMLPGDVSTASGAAPTGLGSIVATASSGSESSAREIASFGLGVLGQRRDQMAHYGGEEQHHGLGGLGIQSMLASRGARERAEEDDRIRRRDSRARGGDAAFEAFHSIPARNSIVNSLAQEEAPEFYSHHTEGLGGYSWNGLQASGPIRKIPSTLSHVSTHSHMASASASASEGESPTRADAGFGSDALSNSSQDGYDDDEPVMMTRVRERSALGEMHARAPSVDSSHSGSSQVAQPDEVPVLPLAALRVSAVNAAEEIGSPDLPSPSSNTSSGNGHKANGADQNPPINTLYVGNLPTSPMLNYPSELEDRLKTLFERQLGFRQLCFRHKNAGPMCFVEFEDTTHATRALSELYGHTLDGLIKNGGIRLSYSKNPLGVRTPTVVANSTGPRPFSPSSVGRTDSFSFAGQFERSTHSEVDFVSMARRASEATALTSPPTSSFASYSLSPPPPRFFAGPSPTSGPGNGGFVPNTTTAFPRASQQSFALPPPSSNNGGFPAFGMGSRVVDNSDGREALYRSRHSLAA